MNVILLRKVNNLGEEGDIVTVKPGYGRNYLFPQGLARMATPGAIRARQDEMQQQVRKRAQETSNAEHLREELEKIVVKVEAKVGEQDRIFGTVTPQQVALGLAVQGFNINRRNISFAEDIRSLGIYSATIKIAAGIQGTVKVQVMPEGTSGL